MNFQSLLVLLAFASIGLAAPAAAMAAKPLSVALVAVFFSGAVLAAALLVFGGPSSRCRLSSRGSSSLFVFAVGLGLCVGSALAEPWSTDLCVRPSGVGGASGAPWTILGSAGASVRKLRVYRNNGKRGYLRGIVVFFTDGTEMRGGVRKDQFADFDLSDGEVVTGATLWQMTNSSSGSARVARIDIATNQKSWGFGVDDMSRLSSKAVNVGSGVLVGFQGRSGDDLDFLAPVFLKTLTSSHVDDIVFEKFDNTQGLRLVTLREGSAVWNGTDYSWTFSGGESRDKSMSFNNGLTTSLGLSTTFAVAAPVISKAGVSASWSLGTSASFDQHWGHGLSLSWSTTIALSKDVPAVSCSALVWEGKLNLAWSGTQTVSADGRSVSFPTSGTLRQVDYGKVETECRPMSPVGRRHARRWAA